MNNIRDKMVPQSEHLQLPENQYSLSLVDSDVDKARKQSEKVLLFVEDKYKLDSES